MTATANVQVDRNKAIRSTNQKLEDGKMNYENGNIDKVNRPSNAFRRGSMMKLFAGAVLGVAMAIGIALPSAANADVPGILSLNDNLLTDISGDFSLIYGILDSDLELSGVSTSTPVRAKANTGSVIWNDDFSMVYGIPDTDPDLTSIGSSPPAKLRVYPESVILNDDFSMVFGIPDTESLNTTAARAKVVGSATTVDWFDMDFLDVGSYDAKVVRSSTSTNWFDLDFLDEGIYDAYVVRSNTTVDWFDLDLLDLGSYDADVVQSSPTGPKIMAKFSPNNSDSLESWDA